MVLAKPTFADVVSSGGELAPDWDTNSFRFEGQIDLPDNIQSSILRDWLINAKDFTEACKISGIEDPKHIEFLEERIPRRWIILRERLGTREERSRLKEMEKDLGENVKHLIPELGDGLRVAEMIRKIAELRFATLSLSPKDLRDIATSWSIIFDRLSNSLSKFGTGTKADELLPIFDQSREQVIELRERVREFRIRSSARNLLRDSGGEIVESPP